MNVSLARALLFPCFAAIVVSGCATRGGTANVTGGLFGRTDSAGSAYTKALQGGIVARSGVTLERGDNQRALEAEYRALEAAPGGQPVTWVGASAKGSVVAAAPYQVGTQNCRQYRHVLDVGGRQTTARGAACRNSDGTWTPLT